jgi:catechol-2,3-dioxygenase
MKILQVELLTADLQLTEHFYSDKLQLKLLSKNETGLSYVAGNSLLTFKLTQSLQPNYHIAFEIPGDKLKEAIDWMDDKIELITFDDNSVIVDFENWNAESIYFYDDNSNILEFIVRHDNNITGDKDFNAASILNVSEVGLVNEHVLQFADELTKIYGIHHYEKQPPRGNFCAMGNASGLFVISGNERNWFPTSTKAVRFPVYVRFEENGNEFELNYS